MSFFNNIFFFFVNVCLSIRSPSCVYYAPIPLWVYVETYHIPYIFRVLSYIEPLSQVRRRFHLYVCEYFIGHNLLIFLYIFAEIFVELEWREEISVICHCHKNKPIETTNCSTSSIGGTTKTFPKFLLMLIVEFIGIVGRKTPYLKLSQENSNSLYLL